MAILYIARESDKAELRPPGEDRIDELLAEVAEEMGDVDARYQLLLKEAVRQCRFVVDPNRAGVWTVADDTECRWLTVVLTALSAVLTARGWPPPSDPWHWMRYFCTPPILTVDLTAGDVDLSEHADWITGKCKACGVQTTGLFECDDAVSAADFERYAEQAAKGEWWCDECYHDRCDDCGEQPRAPEDPDCCAECRASRDAADVPVIDLAP